MSHSTNNKFVSVNLSRSYGQPRSSSSSSSSGFGHGRARSSGGGGMVPLSRPRSSGSAPSRLTVPPPLNLPSLRKEHERLDPSSAPGSSARPGSSGFGSGSGSSIAGWSRPGFPPLFGGQDASPDRSGHQQPLPLSSPLGKAAVLRGEDFPSLKAAVPKQKDASFGKVERPKLQTPPEMRPQMKPSRLTTSTTSSSLEADGSSSRQSGVREQSVKRDGYFPSPLPIIRLSHTSEWADDERDTGLSVPRKFSRNDSNRDSNWARDFSDGAGAREVEGGGVSSREFFGGESFKRDFTVNGKGGQDASSRRTDFTANDKGGQDATSWRTTQPKAEFDRGGASVKHFGLSRETEESDYERLHRIDNVRIDNVRSGFNKDTQDLRYARRGLGPETTIQNDSGRAADQNMHGRYSDLSNNRYRGDPFQNGAISKGSFTSGSRGFSLSDPILKFGRDKHTPSNSRKPYLEDGGLDGSDPFSGGLIVARRKKDVPKEADFHDIARESFEAEIERVQRMQELERQRVIEEQARSLELARREQEDRERLVREKEERRRQVEEEAREAAWKVEQEKVEAIKRTEEQKIAREEERRRILMEEERRKEAARQKLLELEARIAKRQAESNLKDDRHPHPVGEQRTSESAKERDFLRVSDFGLRGDGERIVEHITSMRPSDCSNMKRSFDAGYKLHSTMNGESSFVDKGEHVNGWRRDAYGSLKNSTFLSHEQDNDYSSSRQDALNSGRQEVHGNLGASVRLSSKGGKAEPLLVSNDSHYLRGSRRNIGGEGEFSSRNFNINPEFLDDDKVVDFAWGHDLSRGSPRAPYAERSYQNSEVEEFTSVGRSRRQPRVLPPPLLTSMPKSSFRAANEHPNASSGISYTGRTDESSYYPANQEKLQQFKTASSLAENTIPSDTEDTNSLRCDSQSSLSVSSPPTSPIHLSHDDLDESEDFEAPPTSAVREQGVLSDNEHNASAREVGNTNVMGSSGSISHAEDDEWTTENHEKMQEQEVYDEDENGYLEEEEAHEGNGENLDLGLEYEDFRSDAQDTNEVDQMVLGFDEGVKVKIPINDEFGITTENRDRLVEVQAVFVSSDEELISSDNLRLEAEDASVEETANETSRLLSETEKTLQDLVLDPVAPTTYAAKLVGATNSSETTTQHTVPSVLSSAIPSVCQLQPISSSVSSVASQSEVPMKLQFGLFSGPPLIPSPVPAIQVGSIQMPVHIHPQVGPVIPQMHPSQPPFFQFGQLRYASPISQGILPLAPQTMSFVQPSASYRYSLSQNLGESVPNNATQESSMSNSKSEVTSSPLQVGKQPGLVTPHFDLSLDSIEYSHVNASSGLPKNGRTSQSQSGSSFFSEVKDRYASASQAESHGMHQGTLKRNYRPMANSKERQYHAEQNSSQFFSRAPGMASGNRGKRFAYNVRNTGSTSSLSRPETPQTDLHDYQRRSQTNIRRLEFRVRESVGRRQTEALEPYNSTGQDGKPNFNMRVSGNSARSGGEKDAILCKPTKISVSENLNSGAHSSQVVISDGKMGKVSCKDDVTSKRRMSSLENSHVEEVNMEKNGSSGEDIDAPLQSGVVRVFKQPGIEVPNGEDDFIQVRSKRQMLNDRREQKEKEIKAKSRVVKEPQRRVVSQSNGPTSKSNRGLAALGGDAANNIHFKSVITDGRGFANVEGSPVLAANVASQSLPPIGTPALYAVSKTMSIQKTSVPAVSSGGTKFIQDLSFGNKNGVYDNSLIPLSSWGNADINQQVMALTQSQLDEAMQAARFDSHAAYASTFAHEPNKPSSMQEKSFSSSASSLNSLLAGEKIQFGAVTSPTILPPASRTVSSGIATASKSPSAENESCAHLEDSEAEAEAAASAVAVAAISCNDEIVGNMLDHGGKTGEESISASLPADLSVDVPPLPLWPSFPLPSPQRSSGPMISHFQPISHFPCFEMNPMIGSPIFAFGPHDDSGGNQLQPQRSPTLGSGSPLGPWSQYHSSGDSFYGPPAGYSGPFMSPAGGISGVQPPHMVVYNHFAPVGQFGQVGLSFMGTTYIPTGKPPDWKHNPVPSAVVVNEGDIPMASPLAMFDMSPFQSSSDVPLQTGWPHIPLQHHHHHHWVDGVTSQFRHIEPLSTDDTIKDDASQFPDSRGLSRTASSTDSIQSSARNTVKIPAQQQPASSGQQSLHPIGYSDHPRKMGYQSRNQNLGPDQSFASSKAKKIYVAKSPASGSAITE